MKKILATPRSFGKTNDLPIRLLEKAGYQVLQNPVGGILTKAQMMEFLQGCEGVIVGVDPLDAEVMDSAPQLKAIAKYGVGTDNIDIAHAKTKGIPVSVTAGANMHAVADYAFALMMAVARRVVPINNACHQKQWGKQVALDIYSKKLGILGLGAIGRQLAKRAMGFGMEVYAYDPYWDDLYCKEQGIMKATQEQIYRECDFISLHLPLMEQTANMIGAKQLGMMRPTAILINTARGGLIEEDALAVALQQGKIYGAGIDAFSEEPPQNPNLYQLENLVMGSHTAASTVGAIDAMGQMAAENLIKDLSF